LLLPTGGGARPAAGEARHPPASGRRSPSRGCSAPAHLLPVPAALSGGQLAAASIRTPLIPIRHLHFRVLARAAGPRRTGWLPPLPPSLERGSRAPTVVLDHLFCLAIPNCLSLCPTLSDPANPPLRRSSAVREGAGPWREPSLSASCRASPRRRRGGGRAVEEEPAAVHAVQRCKWDKFIIAVCWLPSPLLHECDCLVF